MGHLYWFALTVVVMLAWAAPCVRGEEVNPGEQVVYKPFFRSKWSAAQQPVKLIPWEGKRVVLLTTTADYDRKTMGVFLDRLDDGWRAYGDLMGRSPAPLRLLNGKVTIAAVPDPTYTCGISCGTFGATGIEVGMFYASDYALVFNQPGAFPHYYFDEMCRNHHFFGGQMRDFANGFAVFMRYVCMDRLKCEDPDAPTRKVIEQAEAMMKDEDITFLQAFTNDAGFYEKQQRLANLNPSDQPVMFASAMLRLRREYGGDEWVKRFYQFLHDCPQGGSEISKDCSRGQVLNWLIAASFAARKDLAGMFEDRWKMSLSPKIRVVLAAVDWKAESLSPAQIYAALPEDELPLTLATTFPKYLTPKRRQGNLLVDHSFEKGAAGAWHTASAKENTKATSIVDNTAKEGKKALMVRSPDADDAYYYQVAALEPNTQYLLCGWVKVKDVEASVEGRIGANLSIDRGYEVSLAFAGTSDWTYVTLKFDSGRRTEATVCARLGKTNSPAKGTAWFDDLCLIELPTQGSR